MRPLLRAALAVAAVAVPARAAYRAAAAEDEADAAAARRVPPLRAASAAAADASSRRALQIRGHETWEAAAAQGGAAEKMSPHSRAAAQGGAAEKMSPHSRAHRLGLSDRLYSKLEAFCKNEFNKTRFFYHKRLSGGVVLGITAVTDARTGRENVLKEGQEVHLVSDLLPTLLNVSGDHVAIAEACARRRGGGRVVVYEKLDGSLEHLLVAQKGMEPHPRACFDLRAMHQTLQGLAAAHARGVVNRDLHAGNVLFKIEHRGVRPPRVRWRVSDFGRACLVGAECGQTPGSMGIAPEAQHVPLTPASDVWSAGVMFLHLRCFEELNRQPIEPKFFLSLNSQYKTTFGHLPRDASVVDARAAASWNASTFSELFLEAHPADARRLRRCPLLARPAVAREGVLLEAMLNLRWEQRPSSAELAREFGDEVRRRCMN